MTSEISGDRNGASKSRKILLTVPKVIFFMADFFSGGRCGTKSESHLACNTPNGIVLKMVQRLINPSKPMALLETGFKRKEAGGRFILFSLQGLREKL